MFKRALVLLVAGLTAVLSTWAWSQVKAIGSYRGDVSTPEGSRRTR